MSEGWWGKAESFIQGQVKSHPFPGGILAEAISMTHSGMLYRLDISAFYFFEPLLLQLFVPWKFINLGLPLSTITLTVNSQVDNHFYKHIYFFSNIIQYEISFLIKIHLKVFYIQICEKFVSNVKHHSYFF